MSLVPRADRVLKQPSPPMTLTSMMKIFEDHWRSIDNNDLTISKERVKQAFKKIYLEPIFQEALRDSDNQPAETLNERLEADLLQSYPSLKEQCPVTIEDLYQRVGLPEQPEIPREDVHDYLNQLLTTVIGLITLIESYSNSHKDISAFRLSLSVESERLARLCTAIKRHQRKLVSSQAA